MLLIALLVRSLLCTCVMTIKLNLIETQVPVSVRTSFTSFWDEPSEPVCGSGPAFRVLVGTGFKTECVTSLNVLTKAEELSH